MKVFNRHTLHTCLRSAYLRDLRYLVCLPSKGVLLPCLELGASNACLAVQALWPQSTLIHLVSRLSMQVVSYPVSVRVMLGFCVVLISIALLMELKTSDIQVILVANEAATEEAALAAPAAVTEQAEGKRRRTGAPRRHKCVWFPWREAVAQTEELPLPPLPRP